jgi:hypothetical protein
MFLKPDGRIDLEHRAYFLCGAPHQSVTVAAAEDGQLSIIRPDLKAVQLHRLSATIRAVAPHPSKPVLAWVDGESGSLTVQRLDGSQILELDPPQLHEPTPEWIQRGFDACSYSQDGRCLWTVAALNAEDVLVQLHDAETGVTMESARIKDPFGGSSCSFHATGISSLTSLWLAGQDGQQVYWLRRTGRGLSCTPEAALTNTIPPVFSPNGEQLLVVNDHHAICQFQFPGMQAVGSPLRPGDQDNPFVESLCYLSDRQALAGTNQQRLLVVDTVQMRVVAEACVEGHEPRPLKEYYPALVNDTELGTDISYFARLGDVIIFAYRQDRGTGLSGWKDTLLWWSVKDRD